MKIKNSDIFKFALPSLFGIWIFMIPFTIHNEINTMIGFAKEFFLHIFNNKQQLNLSLSIGVITLISLFTTVAQPENILRSKFLKEIFVGKFFYVRMISLPIIVAFYFLPPEIGSAGFLAPAGFIITGIAPRLLVLSIIIALTAPLLLDFGLVQFIAVFAEPLMRSIFKMPGHAAVDAIASVLGSSAVSVVITEKLYKKTIYSDREAAVMVSVFSLAGIYNIYLLTSLMSMEFAFPPILFAIYLTSFLLAIILPRMWPLSKIAHENSLYHNSKNQMGYNQYHAVYGQDNVFFRAFKSGVAQAETMTLYNYLTETVIIGAPLIFDTFPLLISIGSIILIIAEHTQIIDFFAMPLAFILSWLNVIEYSDVAKAVACSLIDPFLATAFTKKIFTETSSFLCITIVACSLINFSEIILHVCHTKIPLRLWQMLVIFSFRVVFSLVILIPLSHTLSYLPWWFWRL